MIRAEQCGHCQAINVEAHCPGMPEANCPWIRCLHCGRLTDHAGRNVEPPARKKPA